MKKYFIPLLAFLIPSAHAVDYVQCEAIRTVITRNQSQLDDYIDKKLQEAKDAKYGEDYQCGDLLIYEKDKEAFEECVSFGSRTLGTKEGYKIIKSTEYDKYKEIEKRANKDFKNKGCYWF